jgi:hypothetical protein
VPQSSTAVLARVFTALPLVVPSALLISSGSLSAMTDQTNPNEPTPGEHGDSEPPAPEIFSEPELPTAEQPTAEQPAAEQPAVQHAAVQQAAEQTTQYPPAGEHFAPYPPAGPYVALPAGAYPPPPYPYPYPYPYSPEQQPKPESGLRSWRPSHKAVMITCGVIIGASLLVGAGAIGYNLHPDTPSRPVGDFRMLVPNNRQNAPFFRYGGQPPQYGNGNGTQLPQKPNQLPNQPGQQGSGTPATPTPSGSATTSP